MDFYPDLVPTRISFGNYDVINRKMCDYSCCCRLFFLIDAINFVGIGRQLHFLLCCICHFIRSSIVGFLGIGCLLCHAAFMFRCYFTSTFVASPSTLVGVFFGSVGVPAFSALWASHAAPGLQDLLLVEAVSLELNQTKDGCWTKRYQILGED
jgi:hypothetical protein